MEIKLHLENSDLDIDFEPDFRMQNCCDEKRIKWILSDKDDKGTVANVFVEFFSDKSYNRSDS